MTTNDQDWWRQATVYQIYPRSFCDANGDGIGDLKGITSKVDYLSKLGVDAVWLSPFYPSPLKDGGYDVTDYRDVDPRIGTLDDFSEMTQAFKDVGIKVIVDIVPNHCSDEHVWFQEALKAGPGSKEREKFIFRPGKDGGPPTDWDCLFGGSAWEQVEGEDQWYLHLFDTSQPDWNWDHPEVRADFLKTLRFWADLGVSGFRVDVAMGCAKDMSEPYKSKKELDEVYKDMYAGGKQGLHSFWDRDEVHEIFTEWREVFQEYDPPLTAVAEVWVPPSRKHLYATPKGLGQAFSFDMLMCDWNASKLKECIDDSLSNAAKTGSSTTWVLSNHDVARHPTRYGLAQSTDWGEDFGKTNADYLKQVMDEGKDDCDHELGTARARAAIMLVLALPGSTYIYQGEELGLPEVTEIPPESRQDPIYSRSKGKQIGRDGCRVPIPWTPSGKSFGYSPEDASKPPHLPQPSWFGDLAADKLDGDESSMLSLYQKALALKKEIEGEPRLEWAEADDGVLHFKLSGGWEVIVNVAKEAGYEIGGNKKALLQSWQGGGRTDKVPINGAVWLQAA